MNDKIIEKELSYKLGGIFFKIQKELGRFCREKQYADALEQELKQENLNFKREYAIEASNKKSNFVDFIIENKMLVDLKAKPFIEKDDYFQMKRYLKIANLKLGLIVNFQDRYLKPKRVLNSDAKSGKENFVDSHKFVVSHRLKGQAMIESVIAITIIVVGLLGIFSLLSRSLSLNRVVSGQIIGTNLATEGIELVKNLIDANILQKKQFNEGTCLAGGLVGVNHTIDYNDDLNSSCPNKDEFIKFDFNTGLYSYDAGGDTPYKRVITIEWPSSQEIKVNSLVTWTTRGGGEFSVNLEDHFFNWR